jgi:ribosomal protein S18 acetylase RimI-like enzyme
VRQALEIRIVPATADDAPDILALQKIAYQKEAIRYDDWTIPPLTQTLPEIQKDFKNGFFLKAVKADRIVGSVRAFLDMDTCKIARLIVHPDYQRKGIGSWLMKNIESAFPDAKRFELFTGTKSAGNIRLYRKLGYRETGRQDLSPKVKIVFMAKRGLKARSNEPGA